MWDIQLCELNYGEEERLAVDEVLRGEWLTMGEKSAEFEAKFASFIGCENDGVFVSSATAGLHLILMSLGIGVGDEVIIPGLTFVSDANVVVQLGAKPVFADSVGLEDFNVSIEHIKKLISKKTKAIVIVHFAGFPLELEELVEVCKSNGIILIEDCAHAPGAKINDKMCGTIGDFSFFSFFSNKNLAVGEGGMVLSNDKDKLDAVRLLRSHGMSAVTLERHLGRTHSYDVTQVGLNYRADEMRAALGIEQLKKLPSSNILRKSLFDQYCEHLGQTRCTVPFQKIPTHHQSAYHIMPIILPADVNRGDVINHLRNRRIQASVHYPNFKHFKAYSGAVNCQNTPIVDFICDHELTLPLHPRMTQQDCIKVCDALRELI